jgi:phosphatidylinositol alpha-1,6-mannosyltransferase
MKILIITQNFPPIEGGIATHTYEMAKNFSIHGQEVFVVAPVKKNTSEFDKEQNFRTKRFPQVYNAFSRFLVTLAYSLSAAFKFKPDIIYTTHWKNAGVVAAIISIFFKIPHISAVNGTEINFPRSQRFNYKLFRFVVDRAQKIIALGSFQVNLLKKLDIDESKITVVSEGVDFSKFKDKNNDLINKLKEKYNIGTKKVLLTVGRLVPRKGHRNVILALKEIIKIYPEIVYIIIGRGPEQENLFKLVKNLKLEEYITFTGFISDEEMIAFYHLCDVFVMPNTIVDGDLEGFGIVFVEANACGKPVIGGKSGGTSDIIKDRLNGFLVDPENMDEIKDKILKLLKNDDLRNRMGQYGRNLVKTEFNYFNISKKILDQF